MAREVGRERKKRGLENIMYCLVRLKVRILESLAVAVEGVAEEVGGAQI
jgi:hypothetical protein